MSVEGDGERIAPAEVESVLDERGALVARVTDRREFDARDEHDVSFADPDEAVRERVRDLGLSSAARDLDETIRASKVADSNVAEAVEQRVREVVDDPEAFARADPEDGDDEGDGATGSDDASDEAVDGEDAPTDGDDTGTTGSDGTAETETSPAEAPEEATASADADGQSTWGDY